MVTHVLLWSDALIYYLLIVATGTSSLAPAELRIEELRHHLKIEQAVLEGAQNAMMAMQKMKIQDKKALQEVLCL